MKVGSLVRAVAGISRRGDIGLITYVGPYKDSIEMHVLYTSGLVIHRQCERMFEVVNENR